MIDGRHGFALPAIFHARLIVKVNSCLSLKKGRISFFYDFGRVIQL